MKKRLIYNICSALAGIALLGGCKAEELGPTIPIPEGMGKATAIDAPSVKVIDVRTDGFTAQWDQVVDAVSYEYTFDEDEPVLTPDISVTFAGLAVNTEHILKIRALPRAESGRLESEYVSVNVVTCEVAPLDKPNLIVGSAFTSITVVSWEVVPDAAAYEYSFDGAAPDTTGKTFWTRKGLIKGREYTLKVRALAGDDNYRYTDSEPAEVTFTPTDDGGGEIFFSGFGASSDAVSFNAYANAGQYYWYDLSPAIVYLRSGSRELFVDSLKNAIRNRADELMKKGTSKADAYASVLKSGSANVTIGAYASLSYLVTAFGMDLEGNIITDTTFVPIATTADLYTDGPTYLDEGGWFTQTIMLGSTDSLATRYLSFKRIGTGVTDVKYLLYTTDKFKNVFDMDKELTQDVLNRVKDAVNENGSVATDEALAKINSTTGYNAGYSNRIPGTSYTLVALATNESGKQILAINSIRMRSAATPNKWLGYKLTSTTTTSVTLRLTLESGLDAVSGKLLLAPYTETTTNYTRADYQNLVLEKGTELTADQIAELCKKGYISVTTAVEQSDTDGYIAIFTLTNSTGDTAVVNSARIRTK